VFSRAIWQAARALRRSGLGRVHFWWGDGDGSLWPGLGVVVKAFTTLPVEVYQAMMDVVKAADTANLQHGVCCGATFIEPKPCTCGFVELENAVARWQRMAYES
jgi:hypothetical protein